MEYIIPLISVLIIIGFLVWYKKDSEQKQKEVLKNLYNETLNEALVKVTNLAKDSIKGEKEAIATDLQNKKETIESLVKKIEDDIYKRNKEIQESRLETLKSFSDIKRQVEEHQKITTQLSDSTDKLTKVLSNNQLRGEWGEKILEDILHSSGLEKGIHFLTQEKMQTGVKPDVVILLPESRRISVDAKFPLSNLLKMFDSTDQATLAGLKKQFESDVKTRIKEISQREYISSDEGTLDFAIMFVPNEVVFTYINKEFPHLIDESFNRKIIIASPFSIYAIARTIMQGYRNYYYEQNLKDVLKHIATLKDQFGKFSEEYEKLGRSFEGVYKDYNQISNTRVNMLTKTFNKIEESEKESKQIKTPTTKLIAD